MAESMLAGIKGGTPKERLRLDMERDDEKLEATLRRLERMQIRLAEADTGAPEHSLPPGAREEIEEHITMANEEIESRRNLIEAKKIALKAMGE